MALFKYRAYDSAGAKFQGEEEADSRVELIDDLKKRGLLPAEISEVKQTGGNLSLLPQKVGLADLEFLTSELALLLKSGVRIDRGVDLIRKNQAKPALSKLLNEISKDIKGGTSLSKSIRQFPDVFSELYCNLVELGETSGNLAQVFEDLAADLKFRRELQRKIVGALVYPLVIFFVCILSIVFIFNFVVPRMSTMFEGVSELPWYTSLLLSTSAWLEAYQGFLLLGILGAVIGARFLLQNPNVVLWWQRVVLSLPLFKTMVITVERIRFNSGLALMISAGLAIDKALNLSIGNVSNRLLRQELSIAADKVKRGKSLADSLRQATIYPPFLVSLLEVGEESGNLEAVFSEIAERSRRDFEGWTQRMTTLLEPLMILIMGGIVGGIVIIMLLSMVSVNEFGI